ncbi:DNA helicase UvrD [Candidatus Woesearchaeota archaeon]|nr:MAG: DNA helicase UvrD [Candidatus Woesearchaeota archaeon]
MKIITDLHIHGKYSRGCSSNIDLASLEKWARVKGIDVLGTGDFTHPLWLKHLKSNLTEENGMLKTSNGFNFILQTEISLIYTQDGKGRKIHNVVLAPSFDVVDQICDELGKRGRLDYDGRPIFKITSPEFVEMLRNISNKIEVIPAHCMTPHFGLLGEYNQFCSVEDCFKDQAKYINAVETGLSADPEMLYRIPSLDNRLLVSFSDSHSFWPWRLGREATIFDIKPSYDEIIKAIRTKEGFYATIEFWPEEGKYHLSGHRNCNVSFEPKDAMKYNNVCPVCNHKLTVGVAQRVEEIATRGEGYVPKNKQKDFHLIPLSELIAASLKKGVATKAVWQVYNSLIKEFKSEFNVLLNVKKEELEKVVPKNLAELIMKNRNAKIKIKPGYDGVYGQLLLNEKEVIQKGLNNF